MPRLSFNGDNAAVAPWVRPSDWLPLPNVSSSEQKMVGLVAIFDTDSEFLAFTATGNFTVDWGDGSATENISSGVTAQHKYTYSSISNSTLCSRGYKQVIVTVTPQAGQNFDSVSLDKRHSSASAQVQSSGWLDITCSCRAASTSGFSSTGAVSRSTMLEQCTILNGGSRTSCASMFTACCALQSIPLFNTASVTNMSYMFNLCYSLKIVPLFNTAAVTNMKNMFYSCYALELVPLFNTSSVTDMSNMFYACYSLQLPPMFDMSAVINISYMFYYCYTLKVIPAFNLAAVTSTFNAFYNCLTLSRALFTGLGVNFSLLNCNLSGAALDEIYTNLPTVTGKTITVTGNYGAASDTPSIATSKGWTVTG